MNFTTPPPEGIVEWYRPGVAGGGQKDRNFDRLKAKLTGGTDDSGTSYFSFLDKKLSNSEADKIIANMKKDTAGYPMLQTSSTSGEAERLYQQWIVERYLPVKSASTEGFTDTTVSNEQKEEAVEEEAEEVVEEAEEEVKENIEEAAEVVDEALEDAPIEEVEVPQFEATQPEEPAEEPDLSDIVDLLSPGMLAAVNQKTGSNYEKTPKKPKTSSGSVSNSKILSTLVTSLDAIAGTLSSIDGELKKQNVMLGEALGTTVSNLQEIETSHEGLNAKFDAILGAFQAQTAAAEEALDEAETERDIAAAQGQSDTAGTEGFADINKKKGGGGSGGGGLSKYFGRIARWLWKKFAPKWLRSRLRLLRMKFGPENLKRRAGNFLNSQKERAGNFLNRQKDRAGNFLNRQKDRAGRFISNNRDRIGGFINRNKERIGNQFNRARNFVSGKVDDAVKGAQKFGDNAVKYGDDAVRATKRWGGEVIEGVSRFGQRFGDDAIRYGKRGLAFVRNSPIAKRIALAGAKFGGRMVPVAGSAVSAADAIDRANRGDAVGAWLAGVGGTAGLVTVATSPAAVSGVGAIAPAAAEAVSIAADTGLLMYDIFNAITGREFTAQDQKILDETQQKETGGLTKPGLAVLHGTEAIIPADKFETGTGNQNMAGNLLSPIGGALIGASSNFLTQAGPAAALIAPMFKQVAGSLTNVFDVPTTLAQTNVGGSFAGIDSTLKDVKKKSEDEDENIDPDEFGPEGGTVKGNESILEKMKGNITDFFGGALKLFGITMPNEVDVGDGIGTGGDVGGDGKFIQGNSGASYGIHFHIAPGSYKDGNITSPGGNADARAVAEKVINHYKGKKTIYIGRLGQYVQESDSPADIKRKVKRGQEVHTAGGSQGGIDLQIGGADYPGAKVPFPLKTEDLKYRTGGFGVTAKVSGANASVAHGLYDENGSKAPQEGSKLYGEGGDTPSTATSIIVGDKGKEKVMKNLVASFQPVSDMLDAYNASTTTSELIQATRQYTPEILMYDEEEDDEDGGGPIIIIQESPPPPVIISGGSTGGGGGRKTNATKTLVMQKLLA